jgi:hypothetical protein
MTMNMFSMQSKNEEKRNDVEGMEIERRALEAEVQRLKAREAVYVNTLKIMQDDLPTLEVLNAFEEHMEYGMGLNSLRFANPAAGRMPVVVDATAATEEQIIRLYDGLMSSGVFASGSMSNSRRDDRTGRVSFTMNLVTVPIAQIKTP